MSWCPRCDAIRPGDAGEECSECGADLLDSAVLGRPTRTRNQLLELDRETPAIDCDTGPKPIEATHPQEDVSLPSSPRRVPVRKVAIAGLCLAAVTASSVVYASGRHHARHLLAPHAHSTPTATPVSIPPGPPFGSPVQGRLVFVTGNSLIEVDLTDGSQHTVHIDGGIGSYRISPDRSYGAYIDDHQTLWMMNGLATDERHAVATGVETFTWMPGGGTTPADTPLLVVRDEPTLHGGTRTRVEVIDPIQNATMNLLYEGSRGIQAIFAGPKSIVVSAGTNQGEGIFLLDGFRLRLVRDGYEPVALSPDGSSVLAVRNGDAGVSGFARIDLDTHRVRVLGNGALSPSGGVVFDATGRAVVMYDGNDGPYRVDPRSGHAVRLRATTHNFFASPILLANGRWVFVGRSSDMITLEVGTQVFRYPFLGVDEVQDVQYALI